MRSVGNPFELPASAVFAIEHGVGLARFDHVLDAYPLVPGVLGYLDGSYRRATAQLGHRRRWWRAVAARRVRPAAARSDHALAVDRPPSRADLLVPLLMPEPHRITMPIAANARTARST